jgi:hypothetical protein
MLVYPAAKPWKGFLCLVPGFGETPDRVMQQSQIPAKAAQMGLLTVIPLLEDGVMSFGIDSSNQASLRIILTDVMSKQKLAGQRFYIGGFSIGGSCAVKYSESSWKEGGTPKPSAVFGIDPPLDFERIYSACIRNIRLSGDGEANAENVFLVNRLEQLMGGSPDSALVEYHRMSPYSMSDPEQTAILPLIKVPIRLYTEPDVQWWLKERSFDYTNMNSVDLASVINELQQLGNKDAQLITTVEKGYRLPDMMRHPHSWSIAEADELLKWITKFK